MPGIDPWTYAEKSGKEHAHQAALFMWANMARMFGLLAANDIECYRQAGYAKHHYTQHGKGEVNQFGDCVPQLKWLHAIHNQGHGDAIRGAKAKAEGVRAGVADLFLPVPMPRLPHSIYCGLYLELKVGLNTPSAIQLEFMEDMRQAGYAADWAKGWLEARQKILAYLQIDC
jgi:hypothetical protein